MAVARNAWFARLFRVSVVFLSPSRITSTPMANVGGDVYEATIPGTAAAGLDYYIEAQDDAAQFSTAPGDAPASWRSLAVGTTSIVDIQSMMNAPSDTSATRFSTFHRCVSRSNRT